ncbi:MAG: TolC family protein [Candidatus Zixiibacteriota bacterium]|nr:MAG: TolC family protein [candidate division Zixibacteria bacterium]
MKCLAILAAAGMLAAGLPVLAEDITPETPRLESATPLGPEDLYDYALRHNPDHRKAVATSQASGINTTAAWGTLLPVVDVGYSVSENRYFQPTYVNPNGSVASYPYTETGPAPVADTINGHVFFGFDPTNQVSITYPAPEGESRNSQGWVQLRETIRLGGQQLYGIRNANLAADMNALQVDASQNNLRYNIHQNYYLVLARKRLLNLSQQVLEQRREQLRLAQARFEIGSVTELDVLQAEIDVGNQENAIITAQNNLTMAREDLNRIIGVDLSSSYDLKDDYAVFLPQYQLDELVNASFASRPEYRLAEQQVEFQSNQVKSRRGEFLPDFTASLTHARSQNSGGNVDWTLNPRNRNTSVNLSLSWNLFSGFADRANYEQARVDLNNARYDRKAQEQAVEQQVRQAFYALQETYQQSRITEKNRELAARQLALEQERYRLGATSQLNLRAAQVTFEQAESDYIANVFSFWSNLTALENSVGKSLR